MQHLANWFKSTTAIFLYALLLRLGLCWSVLHTTPWTRFWRASEPGAVAQSLLAGRGFASPYDPTQPTAWIAPIYPAAVVTPVFRAFGAYSWNSTLVVVGLNCLFAALTAVVVFELGKRLFGVYEGATAGWLWATCVPSAVVPLLIWDTSLSALLLAIGLLLVLSLQKSRSYLRWSGTGIFWGCTCLVNPALIGSVPLWAIVLWWHERRAGKSLWKQITLFLVVSVAVVSPWLARNYRLFGRPVFVRSNFSAELYFGNLGFESHPWLASSEYQRLGELPFIAEKQRLVSEYIRGNFGTFAERSVRRAMSFWIVPRNAGLYWPLVSLLCFVGLGLALQERKPGALLFLVVLAIYPLPYYISYVFEKYRHPIEPLMFVLAAHTVIRAIQFVKTIYLRTQQTTSPRLGKPRAANT